MELDWRLFLGLVVLPAVGFAAVYPWLLDHWSRGLVSPYARAKPWKRLSAAGLDALIATTLVVVATTTGAAMYFVLGAVYLLLRDVVNGQSIGKLMFGLAVVDLETGQRTSWRGAIRRNLVLLLPGANLAAVFLEARTILTDAQGQRLGDRIAQTQVVEGFGVRDVATSLQKWLRHLADIPGESRPRRGESGDVGRAA